MTDRLAIALAQLNPTVGAVQANLAKARAARDDAAARGADLVLYPELYVSGYPPEDLVLKPAFVQACREAVEALARETGERGPGILLPTPYPAGGGARLQWGGTARGRRRQNSPLQARAAELRGVRREAGVRRRTGAGADRIPRGAARRADLR